MNFQEALKIVNKAIYENEGRGLSDAEVVVLKGSWENLTYEQMAENYPYTANYLKGDMGHKFWKLLSEALGEPVGKRNFKAALERARSRFLVEDATPTWLEVPDEKQAQKKESATGISVLESDESPKEVNSPEKRKMWQIVFELDDKRKVSPIVFELDDIDDLGEIVKQLEKLGEGSMTVKRIEKGSIVLTLETDPEFYDRINYLFNSGQLQEVLGILLLHILPPFPDELCLKFSPLELDGARSFESDYSNAWAYRNAYFNKLCFNKFATWLPGNVYRSQNRAILPAIWEVVNGSVIQLGKRRLVLIPCEGAKADELCVPQEWIDIPSWSGNYYLAVRVSLAGMRIWGYATHRQLKNEGTYDPCGRTYSLSGDNLGKLSQIWEVPILHTKAAVDPQVTNLSGWFQGLIEDRWQTIEEILETFRQMPERYAYGFGGDRFRAAGTATEKAIPGLVELLYEATDKWTKLQAATLLGRIGRGNTRAIAALSELVNNARDGDLRRQMAVSLGKINPGNPRAAVRRGKKIDLGMQLAGSQVVLVITLMPESNGKTNVHLRLSPVGRTDLPPNLQLGVLKETGEIVREAMSRNADNAIQLELRGDRGDGFAVKVALGEASVTEEFVI